MKHVGTIRAMADGTRALAPQQPVTSETQDLLGPRWAFIGLGRGQGWCERTCLASTALAAHPLAL